MVDEKSATDHDQPSDGTPDREGLENAGNEEAILALADDPDAVRNAIRAQKEIARKAKQERDQLAAKVAEFEDRDKTEQQKLAERAAQYERELKQERQERLRLAVALEKGLTGERAALANRLQGNTKEELEADADSLLELLAERQETSFDGGPRGTPADTGGMDGLIRRAARRG